MGQLSFRKMSLSRVYCGTEGAIFEGGVGNPAFKYRRCLAGSAARFTGHCLSFFFKGVGLFFIFFTFYVVSDKEIDV